MILPTDFDQLPGPEQIFVAIDRERVDRGLAPFVGMVAALDGNAQLGAERANDPPNTSDAYSLVDGEWAGGSANGLDAVFGWMYDDGPDSENLDCPRPKAAGCWGHRQGILDDFGSGPDLVMGAAVDPNGDTSTGDKGGTSMAATLADSVRPARTFVYTWAQAMAAMPSNPGPEGSTVSVWRWPLALIGGLLGDPGRRRVSTARRAPSRGRAHHQRPHDRRPGHGRHRLAGLPR